MRSGEVFNHFNPLMRFFAVFVCARAGMYGITARWTATHPDDGFSLEDCMWYTGTRNACTVFKFCASCGQFNQRSTCKIARLIPCCLLL
jgi:hypothetical protein